jgi:hypothetical protein
MLESENEETAKSSSGVGLVGEFAALFAGMLRIQQRIM